jgi:hypothetical protein
VFHKKTSKKNVQLKNQQTNKRKQVLHKKTSKQKTDLKNQQTLCKTNLFQNLLP